jgi:hypothetical protein
MTNMDPGPRRFRLSLRFILIIEELRKRFEESRFVFIYDLV